LKAAIVAFDSEGRDAMSRMRTVLVVVVGLIAIGVPGQASAASSADQPAPAAHPAFMSDRPSGLAGQPRRDALVSAQSTGSVSRAAQHYDGAPTAKACYGQSHSDGTDGSPLDANTFGLFYGCVGSVSDGWLFDVGTLDAWSSPALEAIDLYADTDADPGTGCGGFEWDVFGFYDVGSAKLLAGLFRLDSCTASPVLVQVADIQHPTTTRVGLQFLNSDWGSPTTVRWYGDIQGVSDPTRDDIPNTGYFTESGFTTGGTAACSTANTSNRFFYVDRAARVDVSRSPAAHVIRRGPVVRFTGGAAAVQHQLDLEAPGTRVYPDLPLSTFAAPNDPGLASQWNLAAVGAQAAWDVGHGSSTVRVADIDSGVDATHPDLAGKLVAGYDAAVGGPLPAGNTDDAGHGTATAGVIGAATDDGVGLASLGYDTAVMPIKVADDTGAISVSSLVRALYFAADNGARVINVSLGGCDRVQAEADAVAYAQSKSALIVAAAGNELQDGNPVEYPAALPGVLAVGATAFDGGHAIYSSTGYYVDLVAPGGSGDSDPNHDVPLLRTGGGVVQEAGTSFAAPLVAAAAALVLASRPDATPGQVAQVLISSADDRGAPGRDDAFGAGVLNAGAAMQLAAQPGPLPSPSAEPDVPPRVALGAEVISAGERVTVNYTGSPGSTLQILARTQPATAFSVIGTVTLNGSGFGSSTHAPQKNTRITARTAAGAASQDQPLIQVRSVSSLSLHRIARGRYTLTGRVYPAHVQRLVSIYRDEVLVAQGRCDASGIYSITKQLAVGPFEFFARTPNDTYNLGTTSPRVDLFVH
jgi:subtilisin family serine protease